MNLDELLVEVVEVEDPHILLHKEVGEVDDLHARVEYCQMLAQLL